MAIHAPTIQHRHVPAVPNLVPAVLAVVLLAVLATVVLLIQPGPAPSDQLGYEVQRRGEIMAGHTGPTSDVLVFRQGEINAANE